MSGYQIGSWFSRSVRVSMNMSCCLQFSSIKLRRWLPNITAFLFRMTQLVLKRISVQGKYISSVWIDVLRICCLTYHLELNETVQWRIPSFDEFSFFPTTEARERETEGECVQKMRNMIVQLVQRFQWRTLTTDAKWVVLRYSLSITECTIMDFSFNFLACIKGNQDLCQLFLKSPITRHVLLWPSIVLPTAPASFSCMFCCRFSRPTFEISVSHWF